MSKIQLKTDGKRYNQLIEKREKQLADLAQLEEQEEQADEAYEKAYSQVMRQYGNADRNDAAAKQQFAERIADADIANEKYEQAMKRCCEFVDETANTFIAIVVELIHDNIDILNGMDVNSKQVFLALNEALPDDIFVDTNMGERNAVIHVHGGDRNKRVRIALQHVNLGTHIMCCSKQNHSIDKERFLADYENGKYENIAR